MTTSDFFVSYYYGNGISEIFTDHDKAVIENEKNNNFYEISSIQFDPSCKNKRPFKVVTLYDAIESEKDSLRDDIEYSRANNEFYYPD